MSVFFSLVIPFHRPYDFRRLPLLSRQSAVNHPSLVGLWGFGGMELGQSSLENFVFKPSCASTMVRGMRVGQDSFKMFYLKYFKTSCTTPMLIV